MKKSIFLLILSIPIILSAGLFDWQENLDYPQSNLYQTRDWHMTTMIREYFENEEWITTTRIQYYYNPMHSTAVDSVITESWDETLQMWSQVSKLIISYEDNYQYVTEGNYYYSMMGMEMLFMRYSAGYDAQHRLAMYLIESLDFATSELNPIMRMDFSYPAGTELEMIYWSQGGDDPESWERVTMTYDSQGRNEIQTTEISADSLNWAYESRVTSVYHPNDTTTGQSFIDDMALYLPRTMINEEFTYMGMINSMFDEEWDGSAWVAESMRTFTYDASDRLIETIFQTIDLETWTNDEKKEYLYDADGNHYMTLEYDFNSTREWAIYERLTYTWSENVTNEEEVQPVTSIDISTYPNPFVSTTEIKSDFTGQVVYKLYNLKGQLVRTLNGLGNKEVVWDGNDERGNTTSSGIYLIRATSGDQSAITKTLKVK